MESWFCWIYLLTLFRNAPADPSPAARYTIHQDLVSFDRAAKVCSPGVLTTLATQQEVTDVLRLVSQTWSPLDQHGFTFWVGLRKDKDECVVPTLPLRGFKWTEDGSEDSQVSRWTEEPKNTCTTVRCAALGGGLDGSEVTWWGLKPVTCKNRYQFICKLREAGIKPGPPEPLEPATPEPLEPATPEPPKPATPEPPKPATPEPPKPDTPEPPKPVTPEPSKPATPEPPKPAIPPKHEPTPATQTPEPAKPKPETEENSKSGSELPEPADPGSDSCQNPLIPHARSISLDRDNRTRIQVECWSSDQLELHCSGLPPVWRLLDDSPANFTAVCLPCDRGFQKDASGNCEDVDECAATSAACRHSCLNTAGSYRCFCSDDNGEHHNEDSPACADGDSILLPMLVAVAALVVLLVVVGVTVKCCLMRRSKERAMKKAEKMAMDSKDGKDSFETANEKAA